jgi:hypothetical protein
VPDASVSNGGVFRGSVARGDAVEFAGRVLDDSVGLITGPCATTRSWVGCNGSLDRLGWVTTFGLLRWSGETGLVWEFESLADFEMIG